MKNKEGSSVTKMVERLILEKVDNEPVERKIIVDYIHGNIDGDVSDGIIAGSFKSLVRRQELEVIGRGLYKKPTANSAYSTFSKVYNLCDKFKADLDKNCTVNLLDMSSTERAICLQYLDILEKGNVFISTYMEELQGIMDSIESANREGSSATE